MRSSYLAPTVLALTLLTACTLSDSPTAPVVDSYDVSQTSASAAAANQAPVASFTWSCTDLLCQFTNTSTDQDGVVVSSFWRFGDGWSANGYSPSHRFSDYGVYTVTLTVTDDDRATGTFSADVTVEPPAQAPEASFTSSCVGLACDFTDTSTEGTEAISSWSWDLGDGTASTTQHPSHAFSVSGTYTVTLTVADASGRADTASTDVTVAELNRAPTASFLSSCTDLSCSFTDTSTDSDGTVVSWMWDFGDGGAATDPSPTHAYATAGTYTVTLTVMDDDGATNAASASVTAVEPNQAPTAAFTTSCTDLSCVFTDASGDPDGSVVAWSWSFGDGSTSTDPSPSHSYAAAGTYSVMVTVTDDRGAHDSASETVAVKEPVLGITLEAVGYWLESHKMVDLTWSGATSDNVDVYRDGWLAGTVPNDGSDTHELNTRQEGTYTYKVCEAGTSVCSDVIALTF